MAKKVVKFGKGVEFTAKGDYACGEVIGTQAGTTSFGEAEFLKIEDVHTEEELSMCISSNLKGYNWQDMIGNNVLVVFVGTEKNKNTKRTYKVYDVYELESADVVRIKDGESPLSVVAEFQEEPEGE